MASSSSSGGSGGCRLGVAESPGLEKVGIVLTGAPGVRGGVLCPQWWRRGRCLSAHGPERLAAGLRACPPEAVCRGWGLAAFFFGIGCLCEGEIAHASLLPPKHYRTKVPALSLPMGGGGGVVFGLGGPTRLLPQKGKFQGLGIFGTSGTFCISNRKTRGRGACPSV